MRTRRLELLEARLEQPKASWRSFRVVVADHATDVVVDAAFATTYLGFVRMPAYQFAIHRIIAPEVFYHG